MGLKMDQVENGLYRFIKRSRLAQIWTQQIVWHIPVIHKYSFPNTFYSYEQKHTTQYHH